MKTFCTGSQSIGARDYQEDSFLIQEEALPENSKLLVVCDGMGGHEGGDIASKIVADVIVQCFLEEDNKSPAQKFKFSLEKANAALADMVEQGDAPDGLGTTIVAAFIHDNDVHWLSVGDSLLYHIRKGQIHQLNDDHSMAPILDQMAQSGRITKEDALSDPQRNALRSAVMGKKIELINIQSKENFLKIGDTLILASDGLLSLSEKNISKIALQNYRKGSKVITDQILEAVSARDHPHQDNTTLITLTTGKRFTLWPFS